MQLLYRDAADSPDPDPWWELAMQAPQVHRTSPAFTLSLGGRGYSTVVKAYDLSQHSRG